MKVHFRKQELSFGLFAIDVAESLHGITPLCNNTIHEIYINLSDNDGHSLMIARQLGVFMNTQLAIVALLPLFYSHICNFARYDDSKCYIHGCVSYTPLPSPSVVISHVGGYKRKDYISMLKILLLMLIILNGSDAQLKRSWHSCVMWRVCEKLLM